MSSKDRFLKQIDDCITKGKANAPKTGGKVKTPKEINRAFRKVGDKMEHGFSVMSEKINPFYHLLKNDKTADFLVKSGEVTNDYLLPAAVSFLKPVGQAAATMVGGPLGGIVFDKVTNYGLSFGNNPEANQKSKLLGNIASITGELASKRFGGRVKKGSRKK